MDRNVRNTVLISFKRSLKIFLVAATLFLGGVMGSLLMTSDTVSSPQVPLADTESRVIPDNGSIHSTFTAVAAKVRPAVVFIKTQKSVTDGGSREERFGPFNFFLPEGDEPRRVRGGGSGFIIDKEGRILTNHHVVRDADRITVVLGESPQDEEYDAEIVGYDVLTDIAVIKIDADVKDLPVVELGDSDEMEVGDWVMAIGTPFGELAGTVTVGVVSAKGRNDLRIMGGEAEYQNYIQTDASINFGNSGGPLVNLRGEAIGINTAINPSGQGIGFAIPINMARDISTQLIDKGRVQYGFMGIRLQELNREIAQGRGLEIERGILVTEVLPSTPAERAGLETGDVIVEYNGAPVRDANRFRLMVGQTEVGARVPLKIVRGGHTKDVSIVLVDRDPPPEEVVASATQSPDSWLGLQVDDARSSEVRERFGVKRGQDGVVVIDVQAGSPAAEAGIREGDVITEVYSQKVDNLKEYVKISKTLKDRKEPIAFLVKRQGMSTYVPVIPEKR